MNTNIIKFVGQRGDRERIRNAKWSYATRLVPRNLDDLRLRANVSPQAGDLVLAKVDRLGQHPRLELTDGRRARMFPGEDIVVVFGNRYAPDQYEALVPSNLDPCDLVASGGIASQMVFKHDAVKAPTAITPVGILTRPNGKAVNLSQYALQPATHQHPLPPVITVVGSSMNSGKTTAAAGLVRGLTLSGMTVNAAKVTGTGSGADIWYLKDAGARQVLDFLDMGYPSTYLLSPPRVQQILETLLSRLNTAGTDFIVLEVADGLFQTETTALVTSDIFRKIVDGVIYASADAMGAVYGVGLLQQWGVPVFAVTGVVTQSPLGMREVQDVVDIPVLGREVLESPVIAHHATAWLSSAQSQRSGQGGRR